MQHRTEQYLLKRVAKTIRAYEEDPERILEDANSEAQLLSGGYGHRQLFELIQNGADAIKNADATGRVMLVLTDTCLYCANEGSPFSEGGVRALLMAHMSDKSGDEIGRFGLGFKSVLGISAHPEVFSDSVAFRFNPPALAKKLQELVGPDDPLPCLRTAELVNMNAEVQQDPVLGELKSWATTVIRLVLRPGVQERLASEIGEFPSAFLVFSPHVKNLTLRVVGEQPIHRELKVRQRGNTLIVREGKPKQGWKVFSERILVSELPEDALADMDKDLSRRKSLPLTWAAPIGPYARKRSRFWAFFPTQDETTLKGILNAPWKTNSDRENLKDGPFNKYLITRAADLISRSIGHLNTKVDPARFLDVLPAQEDAGILDRELGNRLYAALSKMLCIPNNHGIYVDPVEIDLRPQESWMSALEEWFSRYAHLEPDTWAHRTVERAERRSRAKRLGCGESRSEDWLYSILDSWNIEVSSAVIRLADIVLGADGKTTRDERTFSQLEMVLSSSGDFIAPNPAKLAFSDGEVPEGSDSIVHSDIAMDTELRGILERRFKIQGQNDEFAFKSLLAKEMWPQNSKFFWEQFWILARKLNSESVSEIVHSTKPNLKIHVKNLLGIFSNSQNVLIPGNIIREIEDETTKSVCVDMEYHGSDEKLLSAFEVRKHPFSFSQHDSMLWSEYKSEAITYFQDECARLNYSRPKDHLIKIERPYEESHLDVLCSLSGSNAARFTSCLASYIDDAASDEDFDDKKNFITLTHKTRKEKYPKVKNISLFHWVIQKYGWVETSLGPVPVKDAVGEEFSKWHAFLPVFSPDQYESESLIKVESDVGNLSDEHWRKALQRAEIYDGDIQTLTGFYTLMASKWNRLPEMVRCLRGETWDISPRSDTNVTCNPEEAKLLEHAGKPYLLSANAKDFALLVEKWCLRPAASGQVGFIPSDDPVMALSKFPGMEVHATGVLVKVKLQPCRELWMEIRSPENGIERICTDKTFHSDTFYYTRMPKDGELLRALCNALFLELSRETFDRIVQESEFARIESRRETIRTVVDLDEKLLHAIGAEQLRSGIPSRHLHWLESVKSTPSDIEIALLAHSIHGVEVLKAYKAALATNGLQPPSQWAGGSKSIAFVRDLGFPDEYAGFGGQGHEPWENRQAPTTLNQLHPFQEPVRDKLLRLFRQPDPQRSMLTLPTGAGKTRVSVQAMIEWMSEIERPASVLWIAQSEELCEQAVQCWLEAWHALGPVAQWLRVNRLWGATNNRIRKPKEGFSVVVATYQSLMNRLEEEKFAWVFKPDLVVIDEAHGALAPSYTQILKRLGLYQNKSERPLLGLTATPFRGGESDDETYRLANRFEYQKIATEFESSEDLYAHLQEQHILAYADHETLVGESISLSVDEMKSLETYHVLPDSAQQRLGGMEARNQRILDHIRNCPKDWPILVFSVTKDHAEDLAVQLSMTGISARAISGDTPDGRRQRDIEAFKKGEIRVLTNYGVLTTGFDAPKIRAVYVTRPVYSVGLYQQMIGRGLRGPKNGGKDRCLIINVEDNVEQYGHKLAFERFEYLWKKT